MSKELVTNVIQKEKTTNLVKKAPQAVTPPGTEGSSINATRTNRFLIIAATKMLGSFKALRDRTVVKLPFGLLVKASDACKVAEAHTIRFVAENTDIPVPKIYCAFLRKKTGVTYILQERMKGDPLGLHWNERSAESKAKLLAHLKTMIDQLRQIEPPLGTGVHDVCGGSMWDPKLSYTRPMGPFVNVDDFHLTMRGGYDPSPTLRDWPERDPPGAMDFRNRAVKMHQGREFKLVMTHADLNWTNILVERERVTAIIDWGTSGWYPDYWEYARMRIDTVGNHCKQEYVEQVLDPFPDEAMAEAYRMEFFDDGLYGG